MLDKIRLRYGLHWHKPAWRVLAEGFLAVTLLILVIVSVITLVTTFYRLHESITATMASEKSAVKAMQKYESIVITCLNHGVIKVDGDIRLCEVSR